MKVLVFVKATPVSEQGMVPGPELDQMFAAMGAFNERLVKAGIMKEADGLKPSREGKRITFSDSGASKVIDGPFVETKELVAGYWVWNVKSMAEAVEWARQCPNPMPGEEGVLELRPTYSMEDLEQLTQGPEIAREKRLRKQLTKKKAKKKVKKTMKAVRAKAKK